MNRTILLMSAALTLGLAPSAAEACSCAQTSLEQAWHQSSDMFKVQITGEHTSGAYTYYDATVIRPFSGCTGTGDHIVLETGRSSAACGVRLGIGTEWLLSASGEDSERRPEVFSVGMCGWNVPWQQVSRESRDWLGARMITCDSTGEVSCVDGSRPVACFADPCETAQACDVAARCEANYCGGCKAEFFDLAYQPVCEAPTAGDLALPRPDVQIAAPLAN